MTEAFYKPLSRLERAFVGLGFAGLAIFVLATQTRNVGFAPDFHGLVSSHTLAIASHADSTTGFVGYSIRREDDAGKTDYDYFDRNPVFFSAGMNLLLKAAGPSPADKLYLARQVMNVIFLATLAVGFLLVRELTGDGLTAASAAILTFSGSYFMFYKDMIHFEEPALLGLLLLLYAILRRHRGGSRAPLYVCALFAVSFGRGYVSLGLLALWTAIEYGKALLAEWPKPSAAAARWLKEDAIRVLTLATLLTAGYLVYNVATEARVRGVSWAETSIINSGGRRLGYLPDQKTQFLSPWNRYLPITARRLARLALPYAAVHMLLQKFDAERLHAALPLAASLAVLAAVFIAHLRAVATADRSFYVLLVLSGLPWLVLVRRHATLDYTAIYFAGLLLVFYAALCARVPVRLRGVALAVALAVFVASTAAVNADRSAIAANDPYTPDFARMLGRLRPGDRIFVPGDYQQLLRRRPYALGFYLSRQSIAPLSRADYALSDDRSFAPDNLTPGNEAVFLFSIPRDTERRR